MPSRIMSTIRRWFAGPREIEPRFAYHGVEALTMFDRVVVRDNDVPGAAHLAGRFGTVYGETTPSVSDVPVIGTSAYDYAVCVCIDDESAEPAWYAAELLAFVERGAGTAIEVGGKTFTLRADGGWDGPR